MRTVILERLWSGSHGTFGRMSVDGKSWWTVERPQTGPHPAIPPGKYALTPGTHHAGQPDAYPCYWLDNVPNRTAIQIHVANWAFQLEGCIAPGLTPDLLLNKETGQKELGVTSSGDAFRFFMTAMAGDVGTIGISENF